ncbi:murein hydrolase activator EnvC family protein [Bacillus smithii]|uniref:murein hydrolase activator EnvC family protein n=1 Tax=Bacillus smithii TaxID=1479 RepID=UPI00065E43EC|nr:M23 family metallopeptidase [Bacillus smithii]AKP45864.1 peptidoglycan lytic protein P45 [Bacillus smithii]MED4885369.1 peptidoglycan DD-metalloendopeptidase family protein [Bacillus smithii]MED4929019.1 peptidoglycan DD-metalloendopeptidase family protein [Bacillus smithii]
MVKKRVVLSAALAASLGLGSNFGFTKAAFASKISDLESKNTQIEQKKADLKHHLQEKDQKLNELKDQQSKLAKEIKAIDMAAQDAELKIAEKQKQMKETNEKIENLKKEIKVIQKRIQERNEVLKERARALQQSGGSASYIDVLLGAESFSDFIDRATAVTALVNADKTILDEQKKDEEKLENNRKEVEKELDRLTGMVQDLKDLTARLNAKRTEKDSLMRQLAKEQKDVENDKLSLQEEQELLASQQSAIQQAIQSEKNRKKEAAQAPQPTGNEHSVQSASQGPMPEVSSGAFTRPAAGVISSEFGARGSEFHEGIDIANSGSNVPIVAAASGEVIRSYYSTSYGNCIFISHSINGKVFTTVYAHMSARLVQSGHVSKGQVIGYMGSTGQSTGQHLHFEIHEGPWTPDKRYAVNPRKYINF